MSDLQQPIINWQVMAGDVKAGFGEQRVLIISQANGEAQDLALVEDVQPTEYVSLFGAASESLATMALNRFRKHNKAVEVDVIPLAEPAGATHAQGGFKVLGTATENKTLELRIGDDEFVVYVTVLENDTAEQVAAKVVAAIEAKDYPFTAAVDDGDLSLALIDFAVGGEVGNGLVVVAKTRVSGLTFNSIQFSGGAGAYDTEGLFDGVTKRYQTVIFDKATPYDVVKTWLDGRVNMMNTVKGGVGVTMLNGTLSDVKTFANEQNSKAMVSFGNVDEMKFNALPMLFAAEFAAKRSLRLTDGAVLGDLVVDAQEAFGGVNKSSLPYHNTPMSYAKPVREILIEQTQDLNDAGVSLIVPATAGVVLGAVVTNYKYDNTGSEDVTFKYLNYVDTALAIQEYLFVNSQKEFGQTRATGGDLVAGVSMTNALSVKAYIVGLYQDLMGFALAQGGDAAVKAFKKSLTVTLNTATGFYSVYAPTPIVTQFRGLNGVVAIEFDFK